MSLGERRLEEMAGREPSPQTGPQQAVVDLTNRCNNNCLACWTRSPLLRDKAPSRDWYGQELPGVVVKRLIAELGRMGCEILRFSGGGEPMLHPDFEELVGLTAQAGIRCAVTTNGTYLRQLAPATLEAVEELTVSLWSATPQSYARLHPNKTQNTFKRIVAALDAVREARLAGHQRPEVVIANVISAVNHHELEAMLELACLLGAARVYFTLVDPVADRTDGLLLDAAAAAEVLSRARELFPRYRPRIALDNEQGFLRRLEENDPQHGNYDLRAVEEVPCLVGWHFVRVMADGAVVPCCRAVNLPMGNLHDAPFGEIWRASPYTEFRRHADDSRLTHPYFRGIGCIKSCDNLMHNREWQRILDERSGNA
ncbi:MAG: radical SAM protein [bacterium]|nr:radical SAM protein [bacterium]